MPAVKNKYKRQFSRNSGIPAPAGKEGIDIQQELQALMSRYNLSREDVASRLGVSAMTIYRWEHGKNLPKSRLVIREFEGLKQRIERTGL